MSLTQNFRRRKVSTDAKFPRWKRKNYDFTNNFCLFLVNKIFDLLNENWRNNLGYKWLEKHGIQRADYRDGKMDGNSCKKLLLKLRTLRKDVPRRLWMYVTALEAFEKVRNSCFGQTLHFSFKKDIQKFAQAYDKLGVQRTNKVHILIDHVPDFCDATKVGLGHFSEQASEAVHCDYKKTYRYYHVNESNPKFPSKILAATSKYNEKHL